MAITDENILKQLRKLKVYFLKYYPVRVKKNIGAKGNADKTIVRENILRLFSNVNNLSLLDIESLDEHSIDSLAVSYSLYINYKECL